MNLQQYFTKKLWWGKIIGAFFGFIMAGPIGAIFGIIIGNFFDHGLSEHFSNPFWHYYNEKDEDVKNNFFISLFTITGYIAKSNGVVSKLDIQSAKNIMLLMGLNSRQTKSAQDYFNAGKAKNFDLYKTLHKLQQSIAKKPALSRLFIDTQYQYIKQTGVTVEKLDILNNILTSLGMAPVQRQSGFYDEFSWYETRQKEYRHNYQSHNQKTSSEQNNNQWYATNTINDYYKMLGVTEHSTHDEVKRSYRRQISRNHPDKLIAQGKSDKEIKAANEKTRLIRIAYEEICKAHGW